MRWSNNREGVRSPSLEVFKAQWDNTISKGPFQPKLFNDSMIFLFPTISLAQNYELLSELPCK